MYNYLDAMKEDVLEVLRDEYTLADYEDRDELEEVLNDELWINDAITGNASGSYTFNSARAADYVHEDGEDYIQELIREWDIDAETVAAHLFDWEYWDVSIRCYLLGQAISAALDEIDDDEYSREEDEEEEEETAEAIPA